MGMSAEQYWDASPVLAVYYRKAYKLKRQVDNENAWLQGLYFFDAVSVAISNALRKRGQKAKKYIESPIDIFPLTEKEKKRREQQEYVKMQKQFQILQQMQKARKKKEGGE